MWVPGQSLGSWRMAWRSWRSASAMASRPLGVPALGTFRTPCGQWINNAALLMPDVIMPTFQGVLTQTQEQDLAAYLEGLT